MALEFTDTNFQETVLDNKGVSVVDFWAEWCGPCKAIGPIIEELHTDYDGKVNIGKVDVDTNPQISQNFGVRSIPTILFFKNGKVVDKQVGLTSKKALADKIEKALSTSVV